MEIPFEVSIKRPDEETYGTSNIESKRFLKDVKKWRNIRLKEAEIHIMKFLNNTLYDSAIPDKVYNFEFFDGEWVRFEFDI